jgi:glycerol-3-phosphate dehydrogenase (NAD(P)+)
VSETTVGVVGAGAFGAALAGVVARRGGDVIVHGDQARLAALDVDARVRRTADPAELAREARLVVVAVRSTRAAEMLRTLGGVLDGRHLVVHASGAFVGDTRLSEVIRAETAARRIGALAGPALPRDLAAGRSCAMVVASPFDEVARAVQRLLGAPPVLRIYGSRDLPGVELASAVTGAYTVALGLADALGVGAATRAVLVTRCLVEAARLGAAAGARERTFHGLAGLGNLLVRSTSASAEWSEDHQAGLDFAKGTRRETEGTRAAAAALRLARRLGVRAPILEAIHAVAHEGISVEVAAARLTETAAEEE